MWHCSDCQEDVDDVLDACWNCGTLRNGERDARFRRADDLTPSEIDNSSPIDLVKSSPDQADAPRASFRLQLNRRMLTIVGAICGGVILLAAWAAVPRTVDDFYRRGTAHLNSRDYDAAIADFTRALELAEKHNQRVYRPAIYAARAAAHNNRGDFAAALHDVSQATGSADPLGLRGQDSLGGAMFMPNDMRIGLRLIRANALIGLGRQIDAIADLNTVLAHDPQHRQALHLLAIARGERTIED